MIVPSWDGPAANTDTMSRQSAPSPRARCVWRSVPIDCGARTGHGCATPSPPTWTPTMTGRRLSSKTRPRSSRRGERCGRRTGCVHGRPQMTNDFLKKSIGRQDRTHSSGAASPKRCNSSAGVEYAQYAPYAPWNWPCAAHDRLSVQRGAPRTPRGLRRMARSTCALIGTGQARTSAKNLSPSVILLSHRPTWAGETGSHQRS